MTVLHTFWQLLETLGRLLIELVQLGFTWSLLLFWLAWWLWGVNWQKAWPVLRGGAWAPVTLLLLVTAFVWSRLVPSVDPWWEAVPNFYWQLGAVGLLAALTLFCGWLQGVFGWAPPEINLDPPAADSHEHGHHH